MGQNEWTHVNCALWSAEVFEDDDGSLKNVHMAVHRGRQLVRQEASLEAGGVGEDVESWLCRPHIHELAISIAFYCLTRSLSNACVCVWPSLPSPAL